MRTSPVHYIAPSAITLTPNANNSPNDIAVFISRNTVIKVYSPMVGLDTIDGEYQEWVLTGRNRRLADTDKPYTIYARLPKAEDSKGNGYLVFAPKTFVDSVWTDKYNHVTTEGLTDITGATTDADNWYIRLGDVSLPESGERTINLDTGILGTEQFNTEWALNPDALPLRIYLSAMIGNKDAGPKPYVYWGETLVLTATLTEGWTATEIQRFDHWEVTRDSGNATADSAWNAIDRSATFGQTGIINLVHGRGQGNTDDFNSAVNTTFVINAMENTGTEENPVYAVLKSASINIMAETWETYVLSLSADMMTYNPQAGTYSPANGISAKVRATDQKSETFLLTNGQVSDAGLVVEYAVVDASPEAWTPITFSGAAAEVAIGTIQTSAFNQAGLNVRLKNGAGTELYRKTIACLRDGEDSKEREWIFLRSATEITFGTQEHPYPANINGGQVNPSGAATGGDTNKNQDGWVPQGWWDEQRGVDADNHFEYGAYRDFVHENGNTPAQWGAFTTPKIWNHWGENGEAGLYYVDDYGRASSRNLSEGLPGGFDSTTGWQSAAPATTGTYKYIWKRTRQYNPNTGQYGTATYVCLTGADGTAGANSVRLALDNEHEDFLYNKDGLIAPSGGATSQAHLYDGQTEKTANVEEWRISDNNGATWGTTTSDNATANINTTTGLLTISGLVANSVKVRVRAKYNNLYYYAEFTANKTTSDKYGIIVTPNAIAFNSSETWADKTIGISSEGIDAQGNKLTPAISTGNTYAAGQFRVFWGYVKSNGKIYKPSKEAAAPEEGTEDLKATSKVVSQAEANAYIGIYFELRLYTSSSAYRLCDYETVEIAKTSNGAAGSDAAYLVIPTAVVSVPAASDGKCKAAFDGHVEVSMKIGSQGAILTDIGQITGIPEGVTVTPTAVEIEGTHFIRAWDIHIQIPANNAAFPSVLGLTVTGNDQNGTPRTATGTITLVAQKEGAQGEHGINSATVMLYKRSASEPTDKPTATLYYKFADGKLYTTSALITEATTQLNGWSTSIPSGSDPCYVRQVAALSNADYDAIGVSEWGDVKKLVENGANGANGSNTATVMLYKRSSTTISSVGISVTLYYKFSDKVLYTDSACTTPATTQLKGWSRTIPTSSTDPIYVTSAIAYSADAQDAIGSNEWATPAKFTENGAPGSDAINPTLTPDSVIVNQDMTKDVTTQQDTTSIDLSEAYTDVKVYLGRTDVSASATVTSVSATHCEAAVDQNTPRRVKITKIARYYDSEAERYYFYDEGSVNITVAYNGTPYTLNFKFYANLLGTYKTKIESDVKEEVAETKYWTYDKDGRPIAQVNVGDFIHSSSQNTSKLESTVGDPEDPTAGTLVYRTSAIEQHVDNIDLSVAEGNRNLHPNPTFANYNPFVNGTNHATGTLVGILEYGSTIGDYTSIWANEGAQLVALKVLSNTTTAPTVLYAYNSPTDNPRIRLTAGKTYTWSVLVAGDLGMIPAASALVEGSLYNSETGDQRQSPWKYIRANDAVLWQNTTWKQLYATFEIPSGSEYVWFSWIPLIAVLAGATGRIVYGGIRLEDGTKPTIINYSGTEDQLVKTGINIQNRTIELTTNNFIVKNNDGEKTAWIDQNGNLGTSGNIFTGMAVINSLAKMQRFMPYDIDADPGGFSLISHSEQRGGNLDFLDYSKALVPDVFGLTDLVMIEDDYYGFSVHGNEPVQIVFPFIIPYGVVNQDGTPYTAGTPYFNADILKTKTTYKNTDSHFVTADEMAMLIDREFSVFFEQGSRYYNIILPSFERDANGYVTRVPRYEVYWFTDIGGITIHYEHLMFKFTIDQDDYICDGVAPVLKYTQGSGSAFKYRVLGL